MASRTVSTSKNSLENLALGIDLGGTEIRAAIVDSNGTILKRASEPTKADAGPEIVMGQIIHLASAACSGFDRSAIRGAGFSAPGPLDTVQGLALGIPTLKGFVDYPLRAELARKLDMPVTLENDGVAAALGEWKFGAAKGVSNLVYVTVSTGIGSGVIIDGRVLRGRRGMAGHVGHMSFVRGGEACFCGNRGCFEAYGSGSAFTSRAVAAAGTDQDTVLGAQGAPIDAAAVFAAARAGDELSARLVREEAEILGEGFASLLHLYSPDVLVMGGGISNQFDMLRDGIVSSMRRCAMPPFRDTPIIRAALGSNSGLVGAASLVFAATHV